MIIRLGKKRAKIVVKSIGINKEEDNIYNKRIYTMDVIRCIYHLELK